jgi:rare lipoprotein A
MAGAAGIAAIATGIATAGAVTGVGRAGRRPAATAGWQVWAAALALTLEACSGLPGCASTRRREPPAPVFPVQEGIASYYAERFAGRTTASGEVYRPGAMTAAHPTLPLGTVVRVTRIDNKGAKVAGPIEVRINDRGPYARGRIIDLSSEAARRLKMYGGIARVRLEVLKKPP